MQSPEKTQAASASPNRESGWRRFTKRLAVAALVLTILYLARAPLLRLAALGLVHDDVDCRATHGVLFSQEYYFDALAALAASGRIGEVTIVQMAPTRLEAAGVLPSFEVVGREALLKRGVPEAAIHVEHAEGSGEWDRARHLRDWLRAHPGATAVVPCERFWSRQRRYVWRCVLSQEELERAAICAVANPLYDESNWWCVKYGWLGLFDGYVTLAFTWLEGEGDEPWRSWDPETYARSLSQAGLR